MTQFASSRVRRPLCLLGLAMALSIMASTATAQVTLYDQADACIMQDSANGNTGGGYYLYTTKLSHPLNKSRRTLLQFDVSGVEASVNSATLRIYCKGPNATLYAYRMTNPAWNELKVTYNNFDKDVPTAWNGGPGGDFDSSTVRTGDTGTTAYWTGWVEIDVTDLVQAMVDNDQTTGAFLVTSNKEATGTSGGDGTYLCIYSKEYSSGNYKAQLIVDSDAGEFVPSWTTQDAADARTALEAIVATDDPEDIYEAFAEFCRWHFGARAEPLVNEIFGEDIDIIQDSTWSHVSENSASLAWETTVPCYTYVEYGTTAAYGSQTAETDRAYYQHLHQIKNLQINTTYHYRLVAEDEWGNVFATSDATFTTTAVQGAIYVPGNLSGPPYILNTTGATYILTQDITATNNAIKITADDVTLDLNGHTVTFGQNATSSSYCHGLWANGSSTTRTSYRCDNLKIVNGTVVQGTSALLDVNTAGYNFNGLYLSGSNHEVAGLNVVYSGPQAWGYTGNYNTGDIYVHHNVFQDKGAVITSRHGDGVRPMGFRYAPDASNEWEICNNLVKRTRQNGFHKAGSMHNNEVYVDSWPINSFALQPHSVPGEVGGDHYDNKIFATGFNAYGFGWAHEELNIYNNFIHMHGFDLSARWIAIENWGDINMLCGMRVTNYSPGGQVRNDLSYWDNTIVIRGSENCEIRGTEFYTDETIQDLVFFDNHVRVEALDEATTRVACADAQGYYNKPLSKPCYYINNLYESNMYHVRFGDAYGKGLYHMFQNCEFVRLGDRSDYHTFCFDGAYWNYGHVLTDCVFGTGTAPDDVYWKSCNSASYYSIAWTLTLTTAANASVEIKDKDDVVRFTGTADGSGNLEVGLKQYTVHPVEWLPTDPDGTGRGIATGNKLSHQKQQYNDYTVTVTSGGDSASQSVTMDQARSMTLIP